MELFYGGGGQSNPDFRYKVRLRRGTGPRPNNDAYHWCMNYPVTGTGNFQRWYLDTREWEKGYITYQFEWEQPAIMFALSFADDIA